jgi:hypothetical protein
MRPPTDEFFVPDRGRDIGFQAGAPLSASLKPILHRSGFDASRTMEKSPDNLPESTPNEQSEQEGRSKPDLVARMDEARAEFAKLRGQYAEFRRGYTTRLFEHCAFVYSMDAAFRQDDDELSRFASLEYFKCNRQKPNQDNLPHHLFYFLDDAQTDKEREKWLKPAIVLEHFRAQDVPVSEVVQRLKDGGGYARIYKRISGERSVVDEAFDDLDVLRRDPKMPDDDDVQGLRPAKAAGVEPPALDEVQTTASHIDSKYDIAQPAGSRQGHDERATYVVSPMMATGHENTFNAQFDAGGYQIGPAPIRRTRKNTLFVTATPLQIARTFSGKRVAIFADIGPPVAGKLREIVVAGVTPLYDNDGPWPLLVDPMDLPRNAPSVADRTAGEEAPNEVPPTPPALPVPVVKMGIEPRRNIAVSETKEGLQQSVASRIANAAVPTARKQSASAAVTLPTGPVPSTRAPANARLKLRPPVTAFGVNKSKPLTKIMIKRRPAAATKSPVSTPPGSGTKKS